MICYGTGPRVPEIHSTHNLALGGGCTKTAQVLHGFRNVKKKGSFQGAKWIEMVTHGIFVFSS